MQAQVHNVTVSLNKMASPSKQVWGWELPILEEKFPDGLVQRVSESTVEVDALPEADQEYARLAMAFGGDPERGMSFVELAYGRGRQGVSALGQAIQQAAANQAPPTTSAAAGEDSDDGPSSEPQTEEPSGEADDDGEPSFDDDPGPDGEPDDPLG